MTPQDAAKKVLYDGRYVQFVSVGNWEFVERKGVSGIVGIVAVTETGNLLLVEQFRAPVGAVVIEIPAGLAGDVAGQEAEPLAAAAHRELIEETGYAAQDMTELADGAASAGITSEIITLFRATGLKKVGAGAGDGSEKITLHEVPLGEAMHWIEAQKRAGKRVDLKVYAALYFAVAGR